MVSDDQLNLVLVKLVDYLSRDNAMISAAAFDEVCKLKQSNPSATDQLII
jgi:serine/threonine-protein kinase ATR